MKRHSIRAITYIIIAVVMAVAVIVGVMVARNWKYRDWRVLRSEKQEETRSSFYADVNGSILQYSTDGARLQDRQGGEIWNISFSMQDPTLIRRGNTLALYAKRGTEIMVADRTGKLGSFTTGLPIVKATVSEQGNVAAILEDDSNAWIGYYAKDGTAIAAVRTSMDAPGYPMSVSVSPDGELMAVSYLSFADGVQKGVVHIYSFGKSGQNQMDNRIAEFEFGQTIVPEVAFLDDRTCVAFRDNGFTVYEGTKVPKAVREVDLDREIRSVFYDSSHIGLLLSGDEEGTWRMQVYNRSGGEMLQEPVSFPYTGVEIRDSEISLYNGPMLSVYSLNGTEKFNGSYSGDPKYAFAIGKHRYVFVNDSGFDVVQLR